MCTMIALSSWMYSSENSEWKRNPHTLAVIVVVFCSMADIHDILMLNM
jgi:hypothetical protein